MDKQSKISEDSQKEQKAEFFFNQISYDVRQSFNSTQKAAILEMIIKTVLSPSKKVIDARFTFWLFKPFYTVFFLGVDRRGDRRKYDVTFLSKFTAIFMKVLFYILIFAGFIGVQIAGLYLLKVLMGIDLFPK